MHYYPLIVLASSWVFWLWETYLDWRQYQVYRTTQKVPKELEKHIDHGTFVKAKAYAIDRATFGFLSGIYGEVQSTITIIYFLLPYFWATSGDVMKSFGFSNSSTIEWEIFQSIVFQFLTSLVSSLIGLPLSIYSTFVIEERHGFNKQTASFFAWDKCKSFIVSLLITTPINAAMIYIVRRGGEYFFLYLWVLCCVVTLLLTFFHGEIAAIFDKFSPLAKGELRDRIEKLAEGLKFPLSNIFVVESSKRSSHSNAYQSGIFNRKRIVIYDTLIEGYYDKKEQAGETEATAKKEEEASGEKEDSSDKKRKGCTDDEILAVLCHELGHWHRGHLIKNLIFAELNLFLIFMLFSSFYKNPVFYAAFGFNNEMPAIIGLTLFFMVLTPYNKLLGFIMTLISRHFEYEADNFAKKQGYADKLKIGLVKLNIDNLGFPVHDELYSTFNHSHPTLIQRIKALDKTD